MKNTVKFITALLIGVVMLGNAATVFAKNIPDYYSTFPNSRTYQYCGYEFDSTNMISLPKGEMYRMPEKQPDGSVRRFYYVSDGNNVLRLSTPDGEVMTRQELESYFANKPPQTAKNAAATTAATPITATTPTPTTAKPSNSKQLKGISENDLAIWNDEDYEISKYEYEVVRLVNEERVKAGHDPLTINTELCKLARIRTTEMMELNYVSHDSPVYGKLADMAAKFGLAKKPGENLVNCRSAESAVKGWMKSNGHRENMLNPSYKEIGVGFKSGELFEDAGVWSLLLMK